MGWELHFFPPSQLFLLMLSRENKNISKTSWIQTVGFYDPAGRKHQHFILLSTSSTETVKTHVCFLTEVFEFYSCILFQLSLFSLVTNNSRGTQRMLTEAGVFLLSPLSCEHPSCPSYMYSVLRIRTANEPTVSQQLHWCVNNAITNTPSDLQGLETTSCTYVMQVFRNVFAITPLSICAYEEVS